MRRILAYIVSATVIGALVFGLSACSTADSPSNSQPAVAAPAAKPAPQVAVPAAKPAPRVAVPAAKPARRVAAPAAPPESPAPPAVAPKAPKAQPVEQTVYVTRTGSKFHRGTCGYLRQSKIAMTRSEALANGYTPCKVCNP
jgi:hypothetical protein